MGVINIEFLLIQLAQCLSPLNPSSYIIYVQLQDMVVKKKKKTHTHLIPASQIQ